MKEILTFSFISGPKLPFPLHVSAMITSPRGSVVLVGGYNDDENESSSDLWELKVSSSGSLLEWTRLEQRLSAPRNAHLAIPIPDDLTTVTFISLGPTPVLCSKQVNFGRGS